MFYAAAAAAATEHAEIRRRNPLRCFKAQLWRGQRGSHRQAAAGQGESGRKERKKAERQHSIAVAADSGPGKR